MLTSSRSSLPSGVIPSVRSAPLDGSTPPHASRPSRLRPPDGGSGDPPRTVADLVEVFAPLVESKSGDLPVLPGVAVEALRRVRDPRIRVDDLLDVVERDPPLAARILAVANSSYYARGIPIRSLRQAVVRLGLGPLRDVIYMAIYANTVFDAPGFVDLVRETFDHSIQVARVAQRLAPLLGHDEEMAFLAGLLHDVGRARCLKLFAKHPLTKGMPRELLEDATFVLHQAAGAALARAWALPPEVVDACAGHHAPATPFARIVAAADAVSYRLREEVSSSPDPEGHGAADALLISAGLPPEDVAGLVEGLGRELGGRVSHLP